MQELIAFKDVNDLSLRQIFQLFQNSELLTRIAERKLTPHIANVDYFLSETLAHVSRRKLSTYPQSKLEKSLTYETYRSIVKSFGKDDEQFWKEKDVSDISLQALRYYVIHVLARQMAKLSNLMDFLVKHEMHEDNLLGWKDEVAKFVNDLIRQDLPMGEFYIDLKKSCLYERNDAFKRI